MAEVRHAKCTALPMSPLSSTDPPETLQGWAEGHPPPHAAARGAKVSALHIGAPLRHIEPFLEILPAAAAAALRAVQVAGDGVGKGHEWHTFSLAGLPTGAENVQVEQADTRCHARWVCLQIIIEWSQYFTGSADGTLVRQ